MKYIITENKLNTIIEKYLDGKYNLDTINWSSAHDDYGNPLDAYEFYYGDYYSEDYDTVFRLYDKTYWSNNNDYKISLSPILMFENDGDYRILNELFNDKWQPVFKNWFKKKLGFDIKTFDSY